MDEGVFFVLGGVGDGATSPRSLFLWTVGGVPVEGDGAFEQGVDLPHLFRLERSFGDRAAVFLDLCDRAETRDGQGARATGPQPRMHAAWRSANANLPSSRVH